jgi:ABC-type lipoprotein export system ATPase subunit
MILADEPTGNLDGKNKREIVNLLANLNLTQGTTIIMVTHDSHVASHTERMLLLSDGRITKEKRGLHSIKKNGMCPYCHSPIQPGDVVCSSCQKKL